MCNGIVATEENEHVYDENRTKIGSVWKLGSTGRKMYALYDGQYEISSTGIIKVEYMDSGYLESAVEYDLGLSVMSINIDDFTTQAVSCYVDNEGIEVLPSHIYTDTELAELNSD